MGDENDWKKASTEEKVEHKNWKARVEGYEECCKLFRLADDPKSPIFLNYLGLVKKFVVDSNEAARDKALEAVLAFVENIPAAAKYETLFVKITTIENDLQIVYAKNIKNYV